MIVVTIERNFRTDPEFEFEYRQLRSTFSSRLIQFDAISLIKSNVVHHKIDSKPHSCSSSAYDDTGGQVEEDMTAERRNKIVTR